ncbi:ribokinase [Bacillus timonensis]|uniref:ribokinase n=1 Tax=Bacillus timonensis TaxID=1033734 RepID=UPI0002896155|nr:ribokinase [Bacillus timonensis]
MNDIVPKIVVVGSINMDLVVETDKFPSVGETLRGNSFKQRPGGKGANQAVAAARLGASVTLIGALGDDSIGENLKHNLFKEKINIDNIKTIKNTTSGIALITLTEEDNNIIVIPGANNECLLDIPNHEQIIKDADVVLVQLEVPLETVKLTIDLAYKNNIPVVLNPAPAMKLPIELLRKVTYLVPNESEMQFLCGKSFTQEEGIDSLLDLGVSNVILTRGRKGVLYSNNKEKKIYQKDSYKVKSVDTTGAGDAFNGGLAVAIAEKRSLHEAISFAAIVGALAVTSIGSLDAMPYRKKVEEILLINNR